MFDHNNDGGMVGRVTEMTGVNVMGRKLNTVLLIACVLINFGCPSNPVNLIHVPNVVGLTQPSAAMAITAAGLTVGVVTEEFSETVPVGNVIHQTPSAGSSVTAGSVVHLVVSNGSSVAMKLVAAFTATPTAGLAPLDVEFSDQSIAEDASITSWHWDFGDGMTSSEQNPVHRFENTGRHTVSLTVTSAQGSNTEIKSDYINATVSVQEGLNQLVDPAVDAQEAADTLFDASAAVFENEGIAAASDALDAAKLTYFNNGGDFVELNRRSASIPAGTFTPAAVQKRREARKYARCNNIPLNDARAVLVTRQNKADEVSTKRNMVIHLNGLNTDYTAAIKLYFGLKDTLNNHLDAESIEVLWFNNPSSFDFWKNVFDVRECTIQRLTDWVLNSGNSITSADLQAIQCSNLIQEYLNSGKNVILVPYSEGNFYVREATRLLSMTDRGSVAVVETGSPVSSMPTSLKGDVRVDISGDPVALLSGRVTNPYSYEGSWTPAVSPLWLSLLDTGTVTTETIAAIEHHSFLGAYLKGGAGQAVVNHIVSFCETVPTAVTKLAINNGASTVTSRIVTLNNLCSGAPTTYQASESSGFSGISWQPYSIAPTFSISSTNPGVKTVYFRVKNSAGTVSQAVSDTITFASQASTPVITQISPNPVPALAMHQTLTLSGSGFTEGCRVLLRNKTQNDGPWTKIPVSISSSSITLDVNLGAANADWSVQVLNIDGARSEEFSFRVTIPVVMPVIHSFACNGGATTAVSATVLLNNVCTGPPAHYMASESVTFTGASWQPYSTAPLFTFSPGNGTKTVYFKVKNGAGESAVVSDTIQRNENATITEETILLPGNVPLVMVWCPAGTFLMGRYPSEQDSNINESPQHQVTLSQGFWMGKYELTKRQWTAVMGTTPWTGHEYVLNDPDSPAVYVSWNDAQVFIAALNSATGLTFRLPTEAQWEYAARAGTVTRYYWGDDPGCTEIGNYAWRLANTWDLGVEYAQITGRKLPNEFGLYDMIGNVWEWCNDWFGSYSSSAQTNPTGAASGTYRVGRGGSWYNFDYFCRSAYRSIFVPGNATYDIGMRLVR